MKNFALKFPGIIFAITCSFVGGLIMFICMAAGELFVDPEMFRGFLKKPAIWPWIFIESAIWLMPFLLLIVPLLNCLKAMDPKKAARIISLSWIAVGLVVAVVYKYTYYSGDWSLEQMSRPDITFGWTIPYVIILVTFVYLSQSYVRKYF